MAGTLEAALAKPYRRKDSKFWYIAPMINGAQVPQSSKETEYTKALKKLRQLEGKVASDAPIRPRTDRGLFGALLDDVEADYAIKGRRSLSDLKRRIKLHLRPAFGHLRSGAVRSPQIADYILNRQHADPPAENATINRELAILKRAFRLGKISGDVFEGPYIEMLPEDNAREGFFTEDAYAAVMAKACPLLTDVLILAYHTGWRLKSILSLPWSSVDLGLGIIRLAARSTKNRKATVFPLAPFVELKAMLERRLSEKREIERRKSVIIPYVFHREGLPVKDIRGAWNAARKDAGVPGRLLHDMRRTAVRNLKRQGWSDTEVMQMVGFKTLSIMHRYNITTEEDILLRAKRLAEK